MQLSKGGFHVPCVIMIKDVGRGYTLLLRAILPCFAAYIDAFLFPYILSTCLTIFYPVLGSMYYSFLVSSELKYSMTMPLNILTHHHLLQGDIAVDKHENPSVVRIRLEQSKTDPFRYGVEIFLGKTKADLSAYVVVLASVHGLLFWKMARFRLETSL